MIVDKFGCTLDADDVEGQTHFTITKWNGTSQSIQVSSLYSFTSQTLHPNLDPSIHRSPSSNPIHTRTLRITVTIITNMRHTLITHTRIPANTAFMPKSPRNPPENTSMIRLRQRRAPYRQDVVDKTIPRLFLVLSSTHNEILNLLLQSRLIRCLGR